MYGGHGAVKKREKRIAKTLGYSTYLGTCVQGDSAWRHAVRDWTGQGAHAQVGCRAMQAPH